MKKGIYRRAIPRPIQRKPVYKRAIPTPVKKEYKPIRRRLIFKRENLFKGQVPNKPGIYKFYDKKGNLLYVGHARRLRHRVQSYHQIDCPKEHPTKVKLRPKIYKYEYRVIPKKKAQTLEKRIKKKAKYNVL